jgi:hypothetical protein
MTDASRFPLETPCRLSRSVLWRLQRRFFERRGMAAWSEGQVPHHATSNPYLARAYGRVVLGFLRDWHTRLDPSQPVYIVELGAGSGRLAFHFLRALDRLLAGSPCRDVAVRYVMTDFAEANLAAWRAHPSLAPWLDAGRLDLARFDVACDEHLVLERSEQILARGALKNPVIAIANYVFDSLPVDGFSVAEGRLHEWLVRLCSTEPDHDLDDPEILLRATLACDHRRLDEDGDYYGDPALDQVLAEYRARLSDTAVTLPSGALACVARLSRLAGGRLLLLATDKGDPREAALHGQTGPNLTLHGSFSIAVNFHAIARSVELGGGTALVSAERPHSIATCGFVLGAPPGGCPETRQAFAEAIEAQSPDDWFSLTRSVERAYDVLTLDQWIAYLRFADGDPKILGEALPHLLPLAADATSAERADLVRALTRAWDGYLAIGEALDLGFALGTLAVALEAWPQAIGFFEGSLRWHGRTPVALVEIARCHHRMGDAAAARGYLDQALAIDPAYEPALALRGDLAGG